MRPAGRPGVSWILDGRLLVGEYPKPGDAAWLRDEHGVTDVLSLQDDADLAAKNLELKVLEREFRAHGLGFHHHPIQDGDTADLAARLPAVVAGLHDLLTRDRRVLLHCNAGFNRAPTVAIAYLHVHCGLSLQDAWETVKRRRSCAPYRTALDLCFGAR